MQTPFCFASQDPRVQAIRTHPKIGRYSCSTLDECFSDQDLSSKLDKLQLFNPIEALNWALDRERIHLDREADVRAEIF